MKHLLKLVAISALITFGMQTNAQVKFGIKSGLNFTNIKKNYKDGFWEVKTKMRVTYHIGAVIDVALSDAFNLQTGLVLSSKGFNQDLEYYWGGGTEGYDRVIYNYLETPINLTYKIYDFQLYAGPYIAIGISGKNKWHFSQSNGEAYKDEDKIKPVFGELSNRNTEYNALDFGLNFGVGYQIGSALINAGYSIGLGNISPINTEYSETKNDFKKSNRVISLSISYFFE